MECKKLLFERNKKNNTSVVSAEFSLRLLMVKISTEKDTCFFFFSSQRCWPRWLSWMCVRQETRRLRVRPRQGRQHSFVEIGHEIFSTVILSLPLIQEGLLSVSVERMRTILVNHLEASKHVVR